MTPALDISIQPLDRQRDEAWAAGFLEAHLGGRIQARRGELVDVLDGDGLVGVEANRSVGLLTFRPDGPEAVELAALAVTEPGRGIGSALIAALVGEVRRRQAVRAIRVVTTNDNLDALRLYQLRGFRIREVRTGAVDRARAELKPGIPELAANGIPIRDEIELELEIRA